MFLKIFQLLLENEELKEENERLSLYVSKADEIAKLLEVNILTPSLWML